MNKDELNLKIDRVETILGEMRAELNVPDSRLIKAGESLQGALDEGGRIELEQGAMFEAASGFLVRTDDTEIVGRGGNRLHGQIGPAITFGLGLVGASAENFECTSEHDDTVVQLGYNDQTQITVESAPHYVVLRKIIIPSFRGKHGFGIHAESFDLFACEGRDIYDPAGRDSQAIFIGNSPGKGRIIGGFFEAASENILIGGDWMKIPNCRPTKIDIINVTTNKPMHWKGVVPVKNHIELKDGHDVTIVNHIAQNCWVSGQDGWCYVFTPTLGGSILNLKVLHSNVDNVSGIANISGIDKNKISFLRSQILFNGGSYRTNKVEHGGRGIFALITGGPESVVIDGVASMTDGPQFVYVGDKLGIDVLRINNSSINLGTYGISIGGQHQGLNSLVPPVITNFSVSQNSISGASAAFKLNHSNNQWT